MRRATCSESHIHSPLLSFFVVVLLLNCVVFFFQAEDGIRDVAVTGVQTCALPIYQLATVIKYSKSRFSHVVHT